VERWNGHRRSDEGAPLAAYREESRCPIPPNDQGKHPDRSRVEVGLPDIPVLEGVGPLWASWDGRATARTLPPGAAVATQCLSPKPRRRPCKALP
jgi:hypothetical protein